MTITYKFINCHLMESLLNSFFVNNLPDYQQRQIQSYNYLITYTLLSFSIFTFIDLVVWILFFNSEEGGGGVVGVASLF